MNGEPLGCKALAQASGQIAIDFDGIQVLNTFMQRAGQRRQAGPDFNDRIVARRIDRPHDGFNDTFIGQKILTEALASLMDCHDVLL